MVLFVVIPPIQHLCQFLHAALFSPTVSTLAYAIKNGFIDSFPGLTLETIRKYFPKSHATSKGHLSQERRGVMSTKSNNNILPPPSLTNHLTLFLPLLFLNLRSIIVLQSKL